MLCTDDVSYSIDFKTFLQDGKDSDTEYESYNEEDDDEEDAFYMNQGSELIDREQIHLPKQDYTLDQHTAIVFQGILDQYHNF